jgi:hypothetical protein
MTRLGKILVFLNLALSLAMAFWALGVYTHHVDWWTPAATPDRAQGEVFRRRDRILTQDQSSGLWRNVQTAETRWKSGTVALLTLQPWVPANAKWYQDQLTELHDKADPAKALNYKDGLLVLDDKNRERPTLVEAKDKGGQALKALAAYQKEYDDKQKLLKETMDELNKWIKEDTDLTEKMVGDHGLRALLDQEVDKKRRVVAEIDDLKPQVVNSRVEGELLIKRRQALEERVKELQNTGVAAR